MKAQIDEVLQSYTYGPPILRYCSNRSRCHETVFVEGRTPPPYASTTSSTLLHPLAPTAISLSVWIAARPNQLLLVAHPKYKNNTFGQVYL